MENKKKHVRMAIRNPSRNPDRL